MKNKTPQPNNKVIIKKIIPKKMKDKIKILMIEDNLLIQKLVGLMLADWGYKYDIFSNGKSAVENCKFQNYDLILMDIHMPELNGYETTKYIRYTLKLELPILAMTAHPKPNEKEKCLRIGITDIIAKPIKETKLFNLITNHLFTSVVKTEKNYDSQYC